MNFDGVLFFPPVTPFAEDGTVDVALLKEHITSRLPFGPGGVFPRVRHRRIPCALT